MSKNLKTIFDMKIKQSNGAKNVTYYCECCGVHFVAQRRDLTYVICTFLQALRDMQEEDGQEYHQYRAVIQYAIKKYGCTPSDYSILERWQLIKTKQGRNQGKYKALSEAGIKFLEDRLMVSSHHYQIPHCETVLYSKEKTNFSLLRVQFLEKKQKKEPFLDKKNNNI
jgi:hypothetical protein